jgi:hypothetical protein
MSPGERVPAARAAGTPRLAAPTEDPPLLLAHHPLLLPPLRRARARARGVGGSDRAASTATTCERWAKLRVTPTPRGSIAREGAGIHSPMGRPGA